MRLSKYYDLMLKIRLNEEIYFTDAHSYLRELINKLLLLDTEEDSMFILQNKMTPRLYVYSNLYPVEQDHKYKKDVIYNFNIRSVDLNFILKLRYLIESNLLGGINLEVVKLRTYEQKNISKLMTLTPVLATMKDCSLYIQEGVINNYRKDNSTNYWVLYTKNEFDNGIKLTDSQLSTRLNYIKDIMHKNALYKAQLVLGNNLGEESLEKDLQGNIKINNFIKDLKLLNKAPITVAHKESQLLTNKFELEINEDSISQKLAWITLAVGLLEKNTLGLGLCRAK